MSNQIKSVLLPGSFFNIESKRKIQYLNQKEINTLYLFDHTLNPLNKKDDMYEIKKSVFELENYKDRLFNIGTLILNINKRNSEKLFYDYLDPFLEIKNFKLGLGTGDNKFEEMKVNYQNEIDEVIKKLLKSNTFSIDGNNLFLGGNSKSKLNLIRKYSLGINQWEISKMNLEIKSEIYKKIKNPIGNLSQCIHIGEKNYFKNFDLNIELIYILKDSSLDQFYNQIQNILDDKIEYD